ncbi:MAG TPA: Crp/Fnr family transcriptional regulator [Caulobacteraceae bacterium]
MKNNLLASLGPDDYALIAGHLTQIDLEKGRLLYDPGDRIDVVYFPLDAVVSLMTLMESGAAIESATVGREGGVGLLASLAPRISLCRTIVQVPGKVARISVGPLADVVARSQGLRAMVERHNDALMGHAMQSVACNALHSVEARFCRWLLSCHDRIDSDTINLTQEFLADMLGVQRTTVTAVAGALQAKGLIRYRRGVVDILDRPGIEAMACECYGAVRRIYQTLLPNSFTP